MKHFNFSLTFPQRSASTCRASRNAWNALLLLAAASGSVRAQEINDISAKPLLHPLFSENAVLQRDRPLPVWGWAAPQTAVEVRLDDARQSATADKEGRWAVTFPAHATGGTHTLTATTNGQSETRKNLLFGDVWLCSGQSNMAYDLRGALNPDAEIAGANYPEIRLMQVPNAIKAQPIQSFDATWKICSPQTVEKFSGVGYFFGRKLYQELKVPIGLIDSSWSGTPGEAWVSGPALSQMPEFKKAVDELKQTADAPAVSAEQVQNWWQANDPGSKAHQEAPDFDDGAWKTIDEPGFWEEKGYADFDGVMWFRRTINVPANLAGRDGKLNLGSVDDNDTTFWNGAIVGESEGWDKARNYTIPGAQIKAGRNVIAIRVVDTGGGGGLAGPLSLTSGGQTIPLAGQWKLRPGPKYQDLPAQPRAQAKAQENPNAPVVLFNGKIAPLAGAALKGIIWYQGESNADNMNEALQYRPLLPILIKDWRANFGAQTPFYIMQLANFKTPDDTPQNDAWPHLREAQLLAARALPDTYLTVITDLGEEKNVHFPNKQAAGARLANNALEHTYGEKIESSGPTLKDAKFGDGAARLTFDHAQGLNLKGDATRVFAIAGTDLKFSWATPQIVGDVVTLRSPEVAAPVYARYAWSNNPRANLFNSAGVPATPFRTDGNAEFQIPVAQNKADALFNAWNAAFLMRTGGQTYYTRMSTNLPANEEDSWVAAMNVQLAQDAYERTHSPENRQLVVDLMETFIKQYDYDWTKNGWNDDIGWLTITFVRGYQITGEKKYLDKAIYGWNLAYDRGWDTKYGGGGMWENMSDVHPGGKPDKLGLSNNPFVIAGVTLYQITGDAAYLTKSKAMYQWIRENALDKETGNLNQGVRWNYGEPNKPELEKSANVYNSGLFIQAANQLHRVTGDPSYVADAKLAINYVMNKTPILNHNSGGQNQWAYWFVKGVSEFAADNNLWPSYREWMQNNADAVWKNRNDLNLVSNNWLKVNTDERRSPMETSSAVALWQFLPPADAKGLAGNYLIRSVASKLALSVAGGSTAADAAIVQQADPPNASAIWTLVPTGGGYYQIKNAKSGLLMSVAESAVQSGAKIVQRSAQDARAGSDRWLPTKNADGSYSFINRNSRQALDDPALSDAPGTPYHQWFGNSSYAQQFNLVPQK